MFSKKQMNNEDLNKPIPSGELIQQLGGHDDELTHCATHASQVVSFIDNSLRFPQFPLHGGCSLFRVGVDLPPQSLKTTGLTILGIMEFSSKLSNIIVETGCYVQQRLNLQTLGLQGDHP